MPAETKTIQAKLGMESDMTGARSQKNGCAAHANTSNRETSFDKLEAGERSGRLSVSAFDVMSAPNSGFIKFAEKILAANVWAAR